MDTSAYGNSLRQYSGSIQSMFNSVSERYDFLSSFLSFGRDQFWRKALARRLTAMEYPGSFLDLATGSGEQLRAIRSLWPYANLTGLDFSAPMLDVAADKLARLGYGEGVKLVLGDVYKAPFESSSFDSVSISFGIRNLPDRPALYREAKRLLKPGGRFLILELFFDSRNFLAPIHRFHLATVSPWLAGRFFYSQGKAYDYLSQSIIDFPHPAVIMDELEDAGFKGVEHQTYTFQSAMLVWGQKPLNGA
ncbi:MAG: ubiquinone/menaquinone biosynthesis methyltransferase [Deltaproteobacteria bacterium]|jgi:demethylmenaquinone methyltransferase/2-methoxy-6-polyprenyl-1,4-benzoquinol methylase|nr:ubiquinone/menaquinone biosynthesis methyltransferase [Deltaproteobacteria bacterium]